MEKVVVFTSPTCTHCKAAKAFLNEKGVEFEERDVTKDAEARQDLISKGYRGVPIIRVGEEDVVGFNQEKLTALLGL